MAIGQTAQQLKQKQSNVSMIQAAGMLLHILRQVGILGCVREQDGYENGQNGRVLLSYMGSNEWFAGAESVQHK